MKGDFVSLRLQVISTMKCGRRNFSALPELPHLTHAGPGWVTPVLGLKDDLRIFRWI